MSTKGIGLAIAVLLAAYVLLETSVQLLYRPEVPLPSRSTDETPAPADSLTDSLGTPDMKPGRERAGLGFRDPSMALHPYLGYVFWPNEERETPGPAAIPVSEDGFLDAKPALRERAEGRLVVGVTGGSVAGQLGTWHTRLLADALGRQPGFEDLELDFVWLGMPGYHQPQQVIQLAYVLAQGGEFDLVINLDGFNEVAVPAVLNAPQGLHPLFPMNWSMVALDVPDARVRNALGAIAYLKDERAVRLERFHRSFWSFSPIAKLIRRADDRELERRISEYAWALQDLSGDEVPWFIRSSARMHLPAEELVPECVAVWERCSMQLHAICEAHGIRYVHVLQPNQYDPGSKPLSSDEEALAFDVESPYKPAVEAGYPLLREAGQRLMAEGVEFHDLSGVFSGSNATLYVDTCCHFNGEGNRIMVEAMAEAITRGGADARS